MQAGAKQHWAGKWTTAIAQGSQTATLTMQFAIRTFGLDKGEGMAEGGSLGCRVNLDSNLHRL